jgi:hypothetical protein
MTDLTDTHDTGWQPIDCVEIVPDDPETCCESGDECAGRVELRTYPGPPRVSYAMCEFHWQYAPVANAAPRRGEATRQTS